jgi:hypothetical protein
MRKLNKLVAALMLATITLFSACTEKEVPVPTVDTERLDALRMELRSLQLMVYGEESDLAEGQATQAELAEAIAAMEAEIARLEELYNRSVTYGVYVIDFQNNKLANATVKIAQNGAIVSATTDANGYAEFEDVRAGVVNGKIEIDGYTIANYKSHIVESNSDDDAVTYKTSRIALFPAADNANATGMFTLKGNVTTDFSAMDEKDYEDAVDGKKLRFTLYLENIKKESDAFDNVFSLIYEDAVYEATTAADGSYSVNLPARSVFNGYDSNDRNFSFEVSGQDFKANYIARYYNSATNSYQGMTEERIFRFGGDSWINENESAILPGDSRTRNFEYYSSKN